MAAESSKAESHPTPAEKESRDHAVYGAIGLYVFALLVAGGIGYGGYIGIFGWPRTIVAATGVTIGLGATFLFLAAVVATPNWDHPQELLLRFLRDDDWAPSLARLQFFSWSALVLFAFAWITIIRIFSGVPAFSGSFPPNVLGILTISTGSTVVASQIETGAPPPKEVVAKLQGWRSLLDEVSSNRKDVHPSLARFQMLGWTIISIGIYAVIIFVEVHHVWISGSAAALSLPDLDPTLLVLMGISQSGYLGAKYVTYHAPQKPKTAQTTL